MARELSAENIKKVIDVVRKKRLPSPELEKETGISERTLRRILRDYLSYWKLVAQDKDGNWAWYETTRAYATKIDLEIALEHSLKLIPGLDSLSASFAVTWYEGKPKGLKEQDVFALKDAAENHIRTGYPLLSAQITQLNSLKAQRKNLYEIATDQPAPDGWSSLLDNLYSFHQFSSDPSLKSKPKLPKTNLNKVKKLLKKIHVDDLALIIKLEKEYKIIDEQTARDIQDLKLKITHGEPLEGKCVLCTAINVSSN